jgi:hypothetical protein
MMKILHLFLIGGAAAFNLPLNIVASHQNVKINEETRAHFVSKVTLATLLSTLATVQPAAARGRATLEGSYERYSPRIIAGGKFFATDLRRAIEKNDWASIKLATDEPPPKQKSDRAKVDGGTSERAAQAGGFSDARVLVAADLFAAAFSDNSISAKTKKMKDQVAVLRSVVSDMNQAAREGLGEEVSGGGLFGLGAKKTSQAELAKRVRELYGQGGTAWNKYIFEANDELPLSLPKFAFLK